MTKPTGQPRGRPPGAKNKRTIRREKLVASQLKEKLALIADGGKNMKAIDVVRLAMKTSLIGGDVDKAVRLAEILLPYESSRVASTDPHAAITPAMWAKMIEADAEDDPDPTPTPDDENGPEDPAE
jgi:hypothetical protein